MDTDRVSPLLLAQMAAQTSAGHPLTTQQLTLLNLDATVVELLSQTPSKLNQLLLSSVWTQSWARWCGSSYDATSS